MSTCELRNHCRSDPVQVQSTGGAPSLLPSKLLVCAVHCFYELPAIVPKCWAEAPIKIARMTLTIKLDGNWNSFQLANNTPPLSVTGSVIAPSARMVWPRTLGIASRKAPPHHMLRCCLHAHGRGCMCGCSGHVRVCVVGVCVCRVCVCVCAFRQCL